MAELPEDWQNVPNEQEKSEEIKRLTVGTKVSSGLVLLQPCASVTSSS